VKARGGPRPRRDNLADAKFDSMPNGGPGGERPAVDPRAKEKRSPRPENLALLLWRVPTGLEAIT